MSLQSLSSLPEWLGTAIASAVAAVVGFLLTIYGIGGAGVMNRGKHAVFGWNISIASSMNQEIFPVVNVHKLNAFLKVFVSLIRLR